MSKKDYAVLPSTQAVDAIYRILNRDFDSSWNYMDVGKAEVCKTKSRTSETTITIENFDLLLFGPEQFDKIRAAGQDPRREARKTKTNRGLKKIFLFILQKGVEQDISAAKPDIVFKLKELVDAGIFESTRSARAGFNEAVRVLLCNNVSIEGKFRKGKQTIRQAKYILFIGGSIENGVCKVNLNPNINLDILFQNKMIFPQEAYGLSGKGFDLAYTIFYVGRQKKKLRNTGSFNISRETVKKRLRLPEKSRNKGRDIERPIKDSTEELNRTFGDRVKIKDTGDCLQVTFCEEYRNKMKG